MWLRISPFETPDAPAINLKISLCLKNSTVSLISVSQKLCNTCSWCQIHAQQICDPLPRNVIVVCSFVQHQQCPWRGQDTTKRQPQPRRPYNLIKPDAEQTLWLGNPELLKLFERFWWKHMLCFLHLSGGWTRGISRCVHKIFSPFLL